MTQLFYTVFHMSIGACFVIAVVLIARLLLRRAPRKYCYALWLVVLFRLLCPVSFQSAFSLFSVTGAPAHLLEGGFGTAPVALDGSSNQQNQLPALDEGKNTGQTPAGGGALKQEHVLEWEDILTLIWIAGIVVLAGYSAVRGLLLQCRLRAARRGHSGSTESVLSAWLAHTEVWEVPGLETAFVMGVIHPCIYLPAGLDLQTQQYIVAHECTHLRRGDPFWRMLGFAALCLHWYNPFVWVAWMASSRDMEMSCDEAVVRNLGICAKKGYSAALLSLASGQHDLIGKMLAFGKGETGSRIRNVLNYKRPAIWLTIVMTVCMAALGVFLAADPPGQLNADTAGNKGNRPSADAEGVEKQPSGYGVWQADLTHDGTLETISFDTDSLQETGLGEIQVVSSDGRALFSQPLSTSHTGWDTFALYKDGDEAYLFEYNPYFGQGAGSYSYRLFSLSDSGEVLTADEGSVDFSAGMPYTAPNNDVGALISFTDTVNTYWGKSELLVTTDQYMVLPNLYDVDGNVVAVQEAENYYIAPNTLEHPMHYVEQMSWTDIVLNGKKSTATTDLRSRLKAVNRVLAKHRKIARQSEKQG